MIERPDNSVQMIPVAQIAVVNARTRGRAKFKQIVTNIERLGLKKPITVARRGGSNGSTQYDLVCGQGRLEAYKALGQELVPAFVVEADKDDLLVMSLVENLARRRYRSADLAKEIKALKERGYEYADIARMTDLEVSYVKGIVRLLDTGEDALLAAVEAGHVPIGIAIVIASADDRAIQKALTEAYDNKVLRGKSLQRAKRLIEKHRNRGRPAKGKGGELSLAKLMKVFEAETARQGELVRRAKQCEDRLVLVLSGLKALLEDPNLVTLLRAESLGTMPKPLAERMNGKLN